MFGPPPQTTYQGRQGLHPALTGDVSELNEHPPAIPVPGIPVREYIVSKADTGKMSY